MIVHSAGLHSIDAKMTDGIKMFKILIVTSIALFLVEIRTINKTNTVSIAKKAIRAKTFAMGWPLILNLKKANSK